MKFNNNNEYYISLLFFLIIHARLITSAKIKSLGVPQNLKIAKDHINKTDIISYQNGQTSEIVEKNDLDMYDNTKFQNSFLEIKSILEEEIKPVASPSNKIDIREIQKIITQETNNKIGLNKYNNKIKNKTLIKSSDSSLLRNVSEDELVFKLNELEAKFRENYQMEEEKNSDDQVLRIAERRDSNIKNKLNEDNYHQMEETEESNSFTDELKIEEFFDIKSEKKKYLEEHNVFMFYNSLSLVMLSMLGGGVIGIIFILYFSYKDENHKL